jgi:hypothetical protein
MQLRAEEQSTRPRAGGLSDIEQELRVADDLGR